MIREYVILRSYEAMCPKCWGTGVLYGVATTVHFTCWFCRGDGKVAAP